MPPRPRLGLWVFTLYGVVLAATCSLGVAWLDGGELTTAARVLGVPHPTGYPLFVVIGHAATLLPVADVATRVNLAMALLGAATLVLVYRGAFAAAAAAGADSLRSELAGALAAGATQANILFWLHAVSAEVYVHGALAVAAILWLSAAPPSGRTALAASAIAGLAGGLGSEARLAVAIPALVVLARGIGATRAEHKAAVAAAAVAVGAWALVFTVLCLPLRAHADPALSWGDPETAAALRDHLTAARIRVAFAGRMGAAGDALQAGRLLLESAGIPVVLLAAVGLVTGIGTGAGAAATWVVVAGVAYAAWVNPMGNRDLQNGATVAIGLAVLAALGTVRVLPKSPRGAILTAACALLAVVGALPPSAEAMRGVPVPRAAEALHLVMARLPPRALVAVESDDLAGGSLYARVVEGARPDVAFIVQQHAWDLPYVLATLKRAGAADALAPETWLEATAEPSLVARRTRVLRALVLEGNIDRPLLWEPGEETAVYATARSISPAWPLWRLDAARRDEPGWVSADRAPDAHWRHALEARLRAAERHLGESSLPRPGRMAVGGWLTHSGRIALSSGDAPAAMTLLEAAVEIAPESAAAWTNLGALYSQAGRYDEAILHTERALSLAPGDPVALVNAGRYYLARGAPGDLDPADDRYRRALEGDPSLATAWAGRGIVAARRGDWHNAESLLLEALRLDPASDEARRNLERLRGMRDAAPP